MKSTALELAPREAPMDLARVSGVDVASLLDKAVDAKQSVEVLERLMVLRQQARAEAAKEAFDRAMLEFKNECPTILKEKAVPDRSGRTAYKYSPLEFIETQIKPHERAQGFNHTFPSTEVELGWMTACCRITHAVGHAEDTKVKYPIGTKTNIMSDTQQYAAAETFCKRRALCNAYGLVIAGEDMDGSTGRLKPNGPSTMAPTEQGVKELARELWGVLTPVRGKEQNWKAANQWCWDESVISDQEELPNIAPARFKEVITKAKERLAR